MKINYSLITAVVGNLIAFAAGTALSWSSPVLSKLTNSTRLAENPFDHTITSAQASWMGSLVPLGASFGPFIFALAADKIGRKYTLLSLAIPFVLSFLLLAFTKTIALYLGARFALGAVVGGVFTVMPMYIGEIAEDSNRGALSSIMNCFICAGLFFSYCVGPYVTIRAFNVILAVIPAVFMGAFFVLAPESPYYCVMKNDREGAQAALRKLRGGAVDGGKELEEITRSVEKSEKGSIKDLFRSRGLVKALVISLGLASFQQFSGINAVLFYSQQIFAASGSSLAPEVAAIVCGSVQLGTSFVIPLVADRWGRKFLLYISALGMLICEVPLGLYFYLLNDGRNVDGISWLPVVSLVFYIVTYNLGFGPLPWAVMGELFPSNVKSIASSITAGFCWFLGFLITYFFESFSHAIGMGPSFWTFSAFCLAAFLFTFGYVVETKGKSLKEIQDILES